MKEIIQIEGLDDETQKLQTINFSSGKANAVEFCCVALRMPTMDQWLDAFKSQTV